MFFSVLILMGLLAVIIHTDVTRFEIDPMAIVTGSVCVVSTILALGIDLTSHLAAAIVMFAVSFIVHRLYHRGFGLGDYYLFTFMGLVSGLEHLVMLIVANAIFAALCALYYSHIRGKRMFRSAYPAALAGIPATFLVLTDQLIELANGQPVLNWLAAPSLELPQLQIPAPVEMAIAFIGIFAGAAVLCLRSTEFGLFGPSEKSRNAKASLSERASHSPVDLWEVRDE